MLATVATTQQTAGQIGRAAIEPVITSYVSDGAHDLVGEGGRTGVDLGEPYLDLSRLGYGIAGGSLYFRFELRGQIPSQVETTHIDSIWYQVLLDVDADSSTGYVWSGDFTPDYMLQLDSSSGITDLHFGVRKHSGTGNDWSWALIGSTERSGGDAVLAGGIGQDSFVLSCRYGDISVSEGSRIRFFARSGVLYNGIVYNDFVPDKGTVIVTLPPVMTTSSSATSQEGAKLRILFDESHDPFVWSIQGSTVSFTVKDGFSTLAATLTGVGFQVDSLKNAPISSHVLEGVSVLVIPPSNEQLSSAEESAVLDFVHRGGGLLLFGENSYLEHASLAGKFGITPLKAVVCDPVYSLPIKPFHIRIWNMTSHEITTGVGSYIFDWGQPVDVKPPALALAHVGKESWIETDYDGIRQSGEKRGTMVVLAAAEHGSGRVVVTGDAGGFMIYKGLNWNGLDQFDTGRLACNMFNWLARQKQTTTVTKVTESVKTSQQTSPSAATSIVAAQWSIQNMIPSTFVAAVFAIAATVVVMFMILRKRARRGDTRYVEYLARLEELRTRGEISEQTYQKLKDEYWKRIGEDSG